MDTPTTAKNCNANWREIAKIVIISGAFGMAAGTAIAHWLF